MRLFDVLGPVMTGRPAAIQRARCALAAQRAVCWASSLPRPRSCSMAALPPQAVATARIVRWWQACWACGPMMTASPTALHWPRRPVCTLRSAPLTCGVRTPTRPCCGWWVFRAAIGGRWLVYRRRADQHLPNRRHHDKFRRRPQYADRPQSGHARPCGSRHHLPERARRQHCHDAALPLDGGRYAVMVLECDELSRTRSPGSWAASRASSRSRF